MGITSNELIEKFIKEHGKDFPDVSAKEIKVIINFPFNCFRRLLKQNKIESFRVKYFGNFLVHKKRAEIEYNKLDERYNRGAIEKEKYEQSKKTVKEYLESL